MTIFYTFSSKNVFSFFFFIFFRFFFFFFYIFFFFIFFVIFIHFIHSDAEKNECVSVAKWTDDNHFVETVTWKDKNGDRSRTQERWIDKNGEQLLKFTNDKSKTMTRYFTKKSDKSGL